MAQFNRINVSFKNNERDKRLFEVISSKNDKSAFIKDCIEFYLSNNKADNSVKTKKKVKF